MKIIQMQKMTKNSSSWSCLISFQISNIFSNKGQFSLTSFIFHLLVHDSRSENSKLNIHRKTPVLEFLFNKVTNHLGLQAFNFIKKRLQHSPAILLKSDSNTRVFLWILWKFLKTPILKNMRMAAFGTVIWTATKSRAFT